LRLSRRGQRKEEWRRATEITLRKSQTALLLMMPRLLGIPCLFMQSPGGTGCTRVIRYRSNTDGQIQSFGRNYRKSKAGTFKSGLLATQSSTVPSPCLLLPLSYTLIRKRTNRITMGAGVIVPDTHCKQSCNKQS